MDKHELAIVAKDIHKKYPGTAADTGLNGFDLEVRSGTVCGLLGPNGAGKTTAVKILSTLLSLDTGDASVAGYNVKSHGHQIRRRIGLVGQYAAVDEYLTGRQNLVMFGRLNHLTSRKAGRRADELLEQFGLADTSTMRVDQYSGGMRRRLDLAASMIVSPSVLFIDEPTTGLDPIGRREVWNAVRSLVDTGTTVLLTTQYLEEADQLADRISMLKEGRVIAEGTPENLKSAVGGDWVDIVLSSGMDLQLATPIIQSISLTDLRMDKGLNRISVPVSDRSTAMIFLAKAFSDAGIVPEDITIRRPTLDEVFIHLTGPTNSIEASEVAK